MSLLDEDIEKEIIAKGLIAPRITPTHIESVIVGEDYYVFPGTTLTVCCLTLANGINVIGESACVCAANFDVDIGQKIAREDAKRKIWPLEGYALAERINRK